MTTRKDHWNAIFSDKTDPELGWYEKDVSQTLKFLDAIPGCQSAGARIFLPGAGTSMLVDALWSRGNEIILNDISDEALKKLKGRLGPDKRLFWFHHDLSKPFPDGIPEADVWVDRAVLHFLLEEEEIESYFTNLRSTLRPGGHVLLAEFSPSGAPKCAGLELHRYSLEEMTRRLGSGFTLLKHEEFTYFNPHGDPRPYLYALFRNSA